MSFRVQNVFLDTERSAVSVSPLVNRRVLQSPFHGEEKLFPVLRGNCVCASAPACQRTVTLSSLYGDDHDERRRGITSIDRQLVTHQIIIDGFLAGLAVALLQLGLLERMGDVKGARVESAVLIAAVPGIIVIVRRGRAADAAVDAVALGRRVRRRRRAVPVQVPGIIRRVYIIVTATEACTRVFRGLRGGIHPGASQEHRLLGEVRRCQGSRKTTRRTLPRYQDERLVPERVMYSLISDKLYFHCRDTR